MTEPPAAGVHVRLDEAGGRAIYEGEAIYRPGKPHPQSGEAVPQIGIPDDAMRERPRADGRYVLRLRGESFAAGAVYLERVITCWWFVLERAPGTGA